MELWIKIFRRSREIAVEKAIVPQSIQAKIKVVLLSWQPINDTAFQNELNEGVEAA